jgi:hypothetical protein
MLSNFGRSLNCRLRFSGGGHCAGPPKLGWRVVVQRERDGENPVAERVSLLSKERLPRAGRRASDTPARNRSLRLCADSPGVCLSFLGYVAAPIAHFIAFEVGNLIEPIFRIRFLTNLWRWAFIAVVRMETVIYVAAEVG